MVKTKVDIDGIKFIARFILMCLGTILAATLILSAFTSIGRAQSRLPDMCRHVTRAHFDQNIGTYSEAFFQSVDSGGAIKFFYNGVPIPKDPKAERPIWHTKGMKWLQITKQSALFTQKQGTPAKGTRFAVLFCKMHLTVVWAAEVPTKRLEVPTRNEGEARRKK